MRDHILQESTMLWKIKNKIKIISSWALISHLELQLHGSNRLAGWGLGEFLDVGVQIPCWHFSVAAGGGLQQSFVDEDVLVFGLDHVVPLGPHTRHVAIDVYGLLVLHSFQHGINHDEAASSAHARANGSRRREGKGETVNMYSMDSNWSLFYTIINTELIL